MPELAANLTMLFTEYPFPDRFRAARDAGFRWVEMLFPYDHDPDDLARILDETGLKLALFNLPPGDWEAGERGLACLPGREPELMAGLERALTFARALGAGRLHLMAGIAPEGIPRQELAACYGRSLRLCAQRAADAGLEILIEPINHYSMPGYFLCSQEQAADIISSLGLPNVRLQFDFFHCQMEQGCVLRRLERFLPLIGHCQLAGAPDRHEPDTGELNYALALSRLDELGYAGLVGLEYNPAGGTVAGLGWARPWLGQAGAARS